MAGHKTLCGQVRTIHITASHTGAADIKLSGHSDRDERSVLIDHIQAGIGDGLPDGDGAVGAVLRTDFIHATTHYGFSRAIFVDEPGGRRMISPPLHIFIGEGLSADHEGGRRGDSILAGQHLAKDVQVRGRGLHQAESLSALHASRDRV